MLTARIVEVLVNRDGEEVAIASQELTAATQAHLQAKINAVRPMFGLSAEVIHDTQLAAAA